MFNAARLNAAHLTRHVSRGTWRVGSARPKWQWETSGNGEMVQLGGFEPPTSGSTDRRSNHLSYSCTDLGRHKAQASIVSLLPASGWKLGASPALGKGATNWALQIGRYKLGAANRS